jgi:hypothetical protein
MVSRRGSNGRGGGRVGRDESGLDRDDSSNDHAGEKTEAEKVRYGAVRIQGSYRFSRYSIVPPPAFLKRQSATYRRRSFSSSGGALRSR